MIFSKGGRPPKVTANQYRQIREWKPLNHLARELGVSLKTVERIRSGYRYKQALQ